jgi:signal transduction histidine kinase
VSPARVTPKAHNEVTSSARYGASVTAAACLLLTLVVNVAPQIDPTIGSRRFHVALETAASMVLIFVAAVLLGRFRLNASRRTLLKFVAVLLLALDNLYSAVLTIAVDSVAVGGFATWSFAADGALGAALLATAALLPDKPVPRQRNAIAIAIAGSVAVLALLGGLAAILSDRLPSAFETPAVSGDLDLLSEHPALLLVEGFTAACWGLAAIGFARLSDEQEDEFQRWLAISAVIASVAFLNYTLFPSHFTELLHAGDLFFIAATIALLYGAVREISNEEAALIQSAVLEERRRVARDLHDGVAQELAFISSQTRWFISQPHDRQPLTQILDAVERALDESRAAIAALSRPMDEPLDRALGQSAQDVATRVGARLNLDLDDATDVPADWREALLRITREAIANAVRHGHARVIDITLRNGDGVWLRVTDDGDGFDLSAPRSSQSYGLTSMRERTESLGGRFSIASTPGGGTTIEVALP